MAVGTLALFRYAQPQGETYALTLAFTTFVLFQFFNVFNARAEHGSAFNRNFFRNRWLWLSLGAVLALQVLVVHWGPAQAIFRTTDLTPGRLGAGGAGRLQRAAARRRAQARAETVANAARVALD